MLRHETGPLGTYVRSHHRPVVMYARRRTKRTISDEAAFLRALQVVVDTLGGELRTIEFKSHSPLSQATHMQDVDLLVGIHGADLTNLMWMPRGSSVLELNPLWYFHPRFKLMADKLGHHYHVWTCTSPRCAFGGVEDSSHFFWSHIKALHSTGLYLGYNDTTREIHSVMYGKYVWPARKYIGPTVCEGCAHLSLYEERRESNIRMMPMLDEWLAEVGDIFVRRGYYRGSSTAVADNDVKRAAAVSRFVSELRPRILAAEEAAPK